MRIDIVHRDTRAVLYHSDLGDVRSALVEAVRSGVDLRGAYLCGAYLGGADLGGADLRGATAEISKTRLNWSSHALLSAILWSSAEGNGPRQMLAAFVGRKEEWCWSNWAAWEHPEKAWALRELARWIVDGDDAPEIVRAAREEGKP
jgi:hypothetical protein